MLWAMAAPVLAGLLLLLQVYILAAALGAVVSATTDYQLLLYHALAVVALIALRAALTWSGERSAIRGSEAIKQSLRLRLFDYLLDMGPQWSRQQVSGELASAILDQVELFDGYLSRYLPAAVAAVFLPLAFAMVLLPLDWVVGLILLFSAPLIPLFMALVGWGAEAASQRHQLELTRLSGRFADRLRGVFTLKLFGRERSETQAIERASTSLSQRNMAVLRIAFLSSAVLEFFAALGVAGIALYVGLSYLGYLELRAQPMSLQLGLFALFMAPEVYNPLRQLAANYHDRAAAKAALGQLAERFNCFAAQPQLTRQQSLIWQSQSQSQAQAQASTALKLKNLSLPGRRSGQTLLADINLELAPGRHVAMMGPSGAGKTSLLETIVGIRQPLSGQIWLAGYSYSACNDGAHARHDASIARQSLHPLLGRKVLLFSQKPFFLPDTIAANLRLVYPQASEQQMLHALAQAQALEFVQASTLGLQTVLGEGGHGLSGGQLHRLALARLFLLDPAVVLLDEPSAHLDHATSVRLIHSLRKFCHNRTLLLATHDPSLAKMLDEVFVLPNQGQANGA